MAKDKRHQSHTTSELSKTQITFEYDKSWHDARESVRIRTHK